MDLATPARVVLPCVRCGRVAGAAFTRPAIESDLIGLAKPFLKLLKIRAGGKNPLAFITGENPEQLAADVSLECSSCLAGDAPPAALHQADGA